MIPGLDWLQHDFMVQALLATTAMGVLLAYLGIHVVGRGIVFVDLALGQISSMGVAFAGYKGYDPVVCSMAATLAGAALCSRLRVRDPRLRLEAVIGIFYAVSSAITVLLIAKTPHGEADISDVLFGNILALEAKDVKTMLAVFAGVAIVHLIFGKRFFELTYRKGSGEELSARDHGYNLLFYVLLAFAIVFAIRTGGVIPVFAFLILPPVAAVTAARREAWVIVLALLLAAGGCLFGLDLSYDQDLPAGASIVAALGILGLALAIVGFLRRGRRAGREKRTQGGGGSAPSTDGNGSPRSAMLLFTALVLIGGPLAAQAPPAPAGGEDAAAIAREIAALKGELAEARARIEALEAKLANLASPAPPAAQPPAAVVAQEPPPSPAPEPPSPPPAPAPAAAPAPGRGLKLLDLSVDGLFAAGGSSLPEDDYRALQGGGHDPKNRGFTVQNVEMTMSGVVDPYLRGDAHVILQIDEEGETAVELEEAYLTTLALPAGLQAKAGAYFSSFGRLNSQHPHSWDFADAPVVSTRFLGGDGLRGPGAQLSWLLPTPFFAEATFGLQNANGETAFSFRGEPGEEVAGRLLGETSVASVSDLLQVGRLATSFDLTPSLTIVPAVSYAGGPNGSGPDADTSIFGADFYAKWKPLSNDHGWPFFALQGEWMGRRYDAAAQELEDGTLLPAERLDDDGFYLQGVWGFRRRWVAGLRYDHADGESSPFTDKASDPLRDLRERWSTNLTFYPSEFSKLRLQYNWDDAEHLDRDASSLVLQFEFLYGAHGGHKF